MKWQREGLSQTKIPPIPPPRLQGGASHVVSLPINDPTKGEQIAIRSTINLNGNEDRDPSNNVLAGNVGLLEGAPGTTEEDSGAGNRAPESD